MQATLETVRYSDIDPPRFNPRLTIDQEWIKQLTNSIKVHGLQQPFKVRPIKDRWEVVWGQQRWMACGLVPLEEVTVLVEEMSDGEAMEVALEENNKRSDVHPIEEGAGYQRYVDEKLGGTGTVSGDIARLAERLDKSESHIRERMRLGRLAPEVRKAILADKRVSTVHAVEVARIPNAERQAAALQRILTGSADGEVLSARETKAMIKSEFQRDLRLATFPLDNAQLDEEAGPCSTCEKAYMNGGANVCTDTPCFDRKAGAYWEVRKAEAERKGWEVLEGEGAKVVYPWGGRHFHSFKYVRACDPVGYGKDHVAVTLEKAFKTLPPVVAIVREPESGAVFELYDGGDVVKQLAKEGSPLQPHPNLPRPQDQKLTAADKRKAQEEKREEEQRRKALTDLFTQTAAHFTRAATSDAAARLVIWGLCNLEEVVDELVNRRLGVLDDLLKRTNFHLDSETAYDDVVFVEAVWDWIKRLGSGELKDVAGRIALVLPLVRSSWRNRRDGDPVTLEAFAERFAAAGAQGPRGSDVVAEHERNRAGKGGGAAQKQWHVEAWQDGSTAPYFNLSGTQEKVENEAASLRLMGVAVRVEVTDGEGLCTRYVRDKKNKSKWSQATFSKPPTAKAATANKSKADKSPPKGKAKAAKTAKAAKGGKRK